MLHLESKVRGRADINTVYSSPAVVLPLLLFLSSVIFNKHCCGTVVVIPVGSSTFVGLFSYE